MDIDQEMEKRFGPKAVVLPAEGFRYALADVGVTAQVKLLPGQYPHFKFSAIRLDIEPGSKTDLLANRYSGRIVYGLEGHGDVTINGESRTFPEGSFLHLGEGHHAALRNTGENIQQVFVFTFGVSPDGRSDFLAPDGPGGLPQQHLTQEAKASFGLVTLDEALNLPSELKGELILQLPDEGPSFWQAKPSAGFVEIKLAPFTSNVHHYGVLMQTLFTGARVREHGHNQLNEFFVISKGTAFAALDGDEVVCPKGTVIVIGRNVMHYWGNAGDDDAQNFAIIDPPGVEGALSLTGRLRNKGEPWPTDIQRNLETGKILHDRYGFVIRGNSADSVG